MVQSHRNEYHLRLRFDRLRCFDTVRFAELLALVAAHKKQPHVSSQKPENSPPHRKAARKGRPKMPDRCDVLGQRNAHPRDAHIRFIDGGEYNEDGSVKHPPHTYLLDDVPMPLSVSGLWGAFFPHFDADGCLDKYFDGWTKNPDCKYFTLLRYLSLVEGKDAPAQREAIKALWDKNKESASDAGTMMHRDIEFYLNGLAPEDPDSVEFQQFLEWQKSFMPGEGLQPYRTEFSIWSKEALLAGQIDCLMVTKDGRYVMVDWKRCDPKPKRPKQPLEPLGPDQRAFGGETGTGPCAELPNTSFWHYVVQQRVYTYLLETYYDIKVDSSWLVQLHPALPRAHCVEVPRIDDVIEAMMKARYEEVRAKRPKSDVAPFLGA